jgi:acyl dehydratase
MAVREVPYAELPASVGKEMGTSEWHAVTQKDVNTFADVTHDHQWIHIDQERAAKESPYGTTIAHGYFTLSLVPYLAGQIWKVSGAKMAVNYGSNKVRFPAPVPVGSRVRAHSKLIGCEEVKGGYQIVNEITIEVEGNPKPACVAETLARVYG